MVAGMMHAHAIHAVPRVGAGFHLDSTKVLPRTDDEVVRITIAPGFRHHEAEAGGFVKKGGFAEISLLRGVGRVHRIAGKALLRRWNASASSAPGFAHCLRRLIKKLVG